MKCVKFTDRRTGELKGLRFSNAVKDNDPKNSSIKIPGCRTNECIFLNVLLIYLSLQHNTISFNYDFNQEGRTCLITIANKLMSKRPEL